MRTVPIIWYTSARMDALPAPFDLPYVQRGMAEMLLLSVGAGILGCWIVLRGLAFYSHAVGTAAFPGLVLADGLGFAAPLGALASRDRVRAPDRRPRRPGAPRPRRHDGDRPCRNAGARGDPRQRRVQVRVGVETLLFGSLLLSNRATW